MATPVEASSVVSVDIPQSITTSALPSQSEIDAYNDARTPQVGITLAGAAATKTGGFSNANAFSAGSTSTFQPVVKGGVCSPVTLQPATASRSKTSGTAASSTTSTSQPAAAVTLTYPAGSAGKLVWVQMLARGGTLSATDSTGKNYDGSHGFFLTLDANGTATLAYQAPNVGGTYQVLTRLDNVMTTLSFRVPDAAP